MFFGATSFAEAPFSDIGILNADVAVTGSGVNVNTGTVSPPQLAFKVSGNRLNTDTGTVSLSISEQFFLQVVELILPLVT